jgi:hypothetical protein
MLIRVGRRWLNTDRIIGIDEVSESRLCVYLDRGMKWEFVGEDAVQLRVKLSLYEGSQSPTTGPRDVTEEMPEEPPWQSGPGNAGTS